MTRTRVKICGITREEDALLAVDCGADAIGLNFYESSPRHVNVANAQAIAANLPPFVAKVGLFVSAEPAWIEQVSSEVGLDLLQFHGDESSAQCEAHNKPYIKAIRMKPGVDLNALMQEYASASGLLLDTYQPGKPGGTGVCFDWALIPKDLPKPIILAGGLNPSNVGRAIEMVQPYAVDATSGVEASPGKKDPAKLKAFIERAIHATTD